MSLFELILAIGLTALVGLILTQVLIPSMRVSGEVQRRTDLRQQALVAGRWLDVDLRHSSPAAIGVLDNPTVLAVQPGQALAVDGSMVWAQELLVYIHVAQELRRGVWTSSHQPNLTLNLLPTRPTRPSQADLALLSSGFQRTKVVAKNLVALTVQHGGLGESVAVPLRFDFEFQVPDKPEEVYRFQKIVSPRMGE